MRHSRTLEAQRDISLALQESLRSFGLRQSLAYADLIDAAVGMVAAEPARPSSRDRSDLGDGVRSFHLETAAGRRGAASHLLFYRVAVREGQDELIVLRVLHEAMDPRRRLLAADRLSRPAEPRSRSARSLK